MRRTQSVVANWQWWTVFSRSPVPTHVDDPCLSGIRGLSPLNVLNERQQFLLNRFGLFHVALACSCSFQFVCCSLVFSLQRMFTSLMFSRVRCFLISLWFWPLSTYCFNSSFKRCCQYYDSVCVPRMVRSLGCMFDGCANLAFHTKM